MPGTYLLVQMLVSQSGWTDDGVAGTSPSPSGEAYHHYTDGAPGNPHDISWSAAGAARWLLDGGSPVDYASLPPGFTPTTGMWSADSGAFASGDFTLDGFPFNPADDLVVDLAMTALGLNNCVVLLTAVGIDVSDNTVGYAHVTGAYVLWWYSSSLDTYALGDDPGGDYVGVDHPTPRVDAMVPDEGPIAGGTAFTITGGGFLGPDGAPAVESVMFDGEFPATSVVVSDQHTITGVTPAHWKGGVDVVVTLDFAP